MVTELGVDASKFISVLNYDGMPITADNIYRQISQSLTTRR
jgi:2-oxoglutarate/2-oxoacid ferredoxin oxidoreductase subunit alpha